MELLRKYGAATTVVFPLIDRGAQDFEATPVTFAAGDVKIIKDEGAAANATNLPAHEGNGIYSLALSATEMQAARVAITLIDQTATKLWEDQGVLIASYGGSSAQHSIDLIADHVLRRGFASAKASADGDAKSFRSLLGAVAKLVNKVSIAGGTLTVTEDDDATALGTQAVTTDADAAPITAVDTA